MDHDLRHTISMLSATPAALDALLRHLPDSWTLHNEGESTWSVRETVGHLIHGERTDWMPRVRMILEFGDTKTFVPFDRWGHEREIAGNRCRSYSTNSPVCARKACRICAR